MKKKYLNTLVALVLLGALAGFYEYYSRRKASEAPKTETKPEEKVLGVESSKITAFTLKPRDGDPVTCQREGSAWKITAPASLPADSNTISTMLDTLTSATVEDVIDAKPSDLKPYGLDPPSETVEVTTSAKPAKSDLLLGDETPTGGGVYAQVAGNPRVIKLASYVRNSLTKKLFDLRDRHVVTIKPDQVQKIEVTVKGSSYTLVKNPEGVWDLDLPPAVRADSFSIDSLMNQLRDAQMQSVVEEKKQNTGRYGLNAPALTMALSGPGSVEKIVLGAQGKGADSGRYYAMASTLQPVFTLGSDFFSQFNKKPQDFRDKDLFSFSTFDTKHVEITTPKGHQVFDLQNNKWKQTAPSAKDIPTDKMQDVLNELRDLRAASFPKGVSVAAAGLNNPAYRFVVRPGSKNQTETVEVAKVGNHLYARRANDPLPAELSANALDALEKALGTL